MGVSFFPISFNCNVLSCKWTGRLGYHCMAKFLSLSFLVYPTLTYITNMQWESSLVIHSHHAPCRPPHNPTSSPSRDGPGTISCLGSSTPTRHLAILLDFNPRPHNMADLVLPVHHGSSCRENRCWKTNFIYLATSKLCKNLDWKMG